MGILAAAVIICLEIPPTPPPPLLAGMLCPMLNPLQTCPQRDLLINNLPELPILTNQRSCFAASAQNCQKQKRAWLSEIEGCVDGYCLLVKTENKVPGACIRWFGLESPGQKEEEEVLDLDA